VASLASSKLAGPTAADSGAAGDSLPLGSDRSARKAFVSRSPSANGAVRGVD
jgi:hypothetical protein